MAGSCPFCYHTTPRIPLVANIGEHVLRQANCVSSVKTSGTMVIVRCLNSMWDQTVQLSQSCWQTQWFAARQAVFFISKSWWSSADSIACCRQAVYRQFSKSLSTCRQFISAVLG